MARNCLVCISTNREDIERDILRNAPLMEIQERYGISRSAISRHKLRHLPLPEVSIVHQESEELREINIQDDLKRIYARIWKMLDACDEWLRDPDNPEKYSIDLRDNEIQVIYSFETERGKKVKKKALLSTLIREIKLLTPRDMEEIEIVEFKSVDPRSLTLQTANQLQKQLELIAKLMGVLDEKPQINMQIAIINSPEWQQLKNIIVTTLEPYPDAKRALIQALPDGNDIH